MSGSWAIQLEDLICADHGRTTLEIERLQIGRGERVAIVGHNGAGKSTLLKTINAFVQPKRGRVRVLGRELTAELARHELAALRSEIGQVMQGLHLVHRLSALENVLIGCLGRVRGWRGWTRCHSPADSAEAQAALRSVGVLGKAGSRTDRLSGGERQKVAIARMLMQRPKLILADEPTAALDPMAAEEICDLLARTAWGATLITVVHAPSLLPLLSDRVIGLKEGRVAFDLPVAAVDEKRLTALYRSSPDCGQALRPCALPRVSGAVAETAA